MFKKIIMMAEVSERRADENVEAAEMGQGNRPVFFELFKITFCSSCSFYGSAGLINAREKKGQRAGIFNFSRGRTGLNTAAEWGSIGRKETRRFLYKSR